MRLGLVRSSQAGVSEADGAREVIGLIEADAGRFDRIKMRMLEEPADWVADHRMPGKLAHSDDRTYFAGRILGFAGNRATLRLAAGETDAACDDVVWMLGMEKRAVEEWRVNGGGYFAGEVTCSHIWEGVVRQAWSDDHLATMQGKLADIDFGRMTRPVNRAEIGARWYWIHEADKEPAHRRVVDWEGWGRRGWNGFMKADLGEVGRAISDATFNSRPWGWDLALAAGCLSDLRELRKTMVPGKSPTPADWQKLQALDDPGAGRSLDEPGFREGGCVW
ncbi:MAG: hypothetical protein QM755_17035 [Luteolibacter sp.]